MAEPHEISEHFIPAEAVLFGERRGRIPSSVTEMIIGYLLDETEYLTENEELVNSLQPGDVVTVEVSRQSGPTTGFKMLLDEQGHWHVNTETMHPFTWKSLFLEMLERDELASFKQAYEEFITVPAAKLEEKNEPQTLPVLTQYQLADTWNLSYQDTKLDALWQQFRETPKAGIDPQRIIFQPDDPTLDLLTYHGAIEYQGHTMRFAVNEAGNQYVVAADDAEKLRAQLAAPVDAAPVYYPLQEVEKMLEVKPGTLTTILIGKDNQEGFFDSDNFPEALQQIDIVRAVGNRSFMLNHKDIAAVADYMHVLPPNASGYLNQEQVRERVGELEGFDAAWQGLVVTTLKAPYGEPIIIEDKPLDMRLRAFGNRNQYFLHQDDVTKFQELISQGLAQAPSSHLPPEDRGGPEGYSR